jgi:hypothetical protein
MSTKIEDKPIAHAGADSSPRCAVSTGSAGSVSDAREYPDCEEPSPTCDRCGGEGWIDYLDGDGGDWGEDCPSEENHPIVCRACGGTGYAQ